MSGDCKGEENGQAAERLILEESLLGLCPVSPIGGG